jgi:hypothetical protein
MEASRVSQQENPLEAPSPKLLRQILSIEPSVDGKLKYRPCLVTLRDGRRRDFVYVQEVEEYLRYWGVLPDDDEGKRSVDFREVVAVEESPNRLPVDIANRLYDRGESGMGYYTFTLILQDGSEIVCLTGGAVDFVELPQGVSVGDVTGVSHIGWRERLSEGGYAETAPYAWCLYSAPNRSPWSRLKQIYRRVAPSHVGREEVSTVEEEQE